MVEASAPSPVSARGVVVVYRAGVGGSNRFRSQTCWRQKGSRSLPADLSSIQSAILPAEGGPKSAIESFPTPPSASLRLAPFDRLRASRSLRAGLCDLPGSGQAPAGLPRQGATAPLARVRLAVEPRQARPARVPWPAGRQRQGRWVPKNRPKIPPKTRAKKLSTIAGCHKSRHRIQRGDRGDRSPEGPFLNMGRKTGIGERLTAGTRKWP